MDPRNQPGSPEDLVWMRKALRLALRGFGRTSPNPLVGAVLVKDHKVIGEGWHRRAGLPHAEIEAIQHARSRGEDPAGATLVVTLEPCSTQGRTPPCTEAIAASRIARVVAGATDPNPVHAGRGFERLAAADIQVTRGVLAAEAARLNEAFNHWIVHRTPFVTLKAGTSADGKIATASGESRWITGLRSRAFRMRLRRGADAILVGVNTILRDDPLLTIRCGERETGKPLRRIVLDARARTPSNARVLSGEKTPSTTICVAESADPRRVGELSKQARVRIAPASGGQIDLGWLLRELGRDGVTSLLVEGGGEVNASFLFGGFVHRIVLLYAPLIIGGRGAPGIFGGTGTASLAQAPRLREVEWRRMGEDLMLTALVGPPQPSA
ncbi:MAG: bifunctional diaminohydroxyphosphoribosylaminopyrimidine deaminase/5-amino-6-(5-phosphoribosylamino)uracil reductase RibD [Verrucomicrobiia bacterium]